MWRWTHPEKHRYYQADLVKDLFDDWQVITAWGGVGSRRGGRRNLYVPSQEAGLQQLAAIDRRRRQRGYRGTGEGGHARATPADRLANPRAGA